MSDRVTTSSTLPFQAWAQGATVEGVECDLVLETHVRSNLAEGARRLHRRLGIH